MAEYGIPYMGSKSKICNELIKIFPKADNFYDLFGGGFSVTHAMLVRRKNHYKSFHFNELRPGVCDLIKKAISGEFNYSVFKPPFISREEFLSKFETDAYIKCLWSFGNNGKNYLFSKAVEPYKRSMHNAIIFNEFDSLAKQTLGMERFKDGYQVIDRRMFLRNKIEQFRINGIPDFLYPFLNESQRVHLKSAKELRQLQQLQQLQQLERLQQLQQLQQLERLERLEFYNTTYEKIPIKENSVIYCDPPYAGTADYQNIFNTKKFLDWAADQTHPVFISEYNISDKRFHKIFKIKKRSLLSANKSMKEKEENVYANEPGRIAFMKHATDSIRQKSFTN